MYRDVLIQAVLNGWKVKVGCQEVVFHNSTEMLVTLKRYYEEPDAVEREFLSTAHAKHVFPATVGRSTNYPPIEGLPATPQDGSCLSRRHYEGEEWTFLSNAILKATQESTTRR